MDEFTLVEPRRIVWHVAYHNYDRPKVRLFEAQEEAERCFNALSGQYEWVSLDRSIIEHTDTADTSQTEQPDCPWE